MVKHAAYLVLALVAWMGFAVSPAVAQETVTITIPVDESTAEPHALQLTSDGAGGWMAESDAMTAMFPAVSANDPIRVRATDHAAMSMLTTRYLAQDGAGRTIGEWVPSSVLGEADAASVAYRGVLPGIDEEFAVSASRVKHDAVLQVAPSLPATTAAFGFESRLAVPAGYTVTPMPSTDDEQRIAAIAIVSPDGLTVYTLPAVVASDANGASVAGWYEIADGPKNSLLVRAMIETAWFATAAFPVRLDPTITITATNSNNVIPFQWVHDGTYPLGSVYQQSYTATQLQNTAGTITQVGLQFNVAVANTTINRVVIRMGETSMASPATLFTDNFNVNGSQLVYDGPVTFNAAIGGYSTITLQTAYYYSGANSILLQFEVHPGSSGNGYLQLRMESNAAFSGSWRNYNSNLGSTSRTGFTTGFFPGAQFEIIPGPAITAPAGNTLPTQQAGTPVNIACTASGGVTPYAWSATGLPTGVSIDPNTGVISGSPSATGTFNVDITVTDTNNDTDTNSYTWDITAPPITLTAPAGNTIPEAYEGDTVNLQFAATGGTAPYTFSAANLPAGVSMSAAGLLSGTLAAGSAGSHSIDVTVTDNNNLSVVIAVSWEVFALPIADGTPTNATEGFAYTFTFTVTGGKAAFTWAISSTPALPAGLSFNTSTGTLSGTPASGDAGSYSLTVTVTDANAKTDDHTATLTIDPEVSITLGSLPDGTDTGDYGPVSVTTSGGVGPFTFGASGLPSGLSINASTGAISGIVAANQSATSPFSVTLTVTDTNAFSTQTTLNLTVNAIPTLSVSTLPTGGLGTAYIGVQLVANGGTGPFTWVVTGLPDGLTANANGQITGTITVNNTAGDHTISITVTDANGVSNTVTANMPLVVADTNIGGKGCGTTPGTPAPWMLLVLLLSIGLLALRRRAA